jgi:2-polyprenyl-3-methyl-5-hydroxy-6-metoxy-1,4-benzoquinol methylase
MASIIDERGFNQGFKLTEAQQIRLQRRAESIIAEMHLSVALPARRQIHILELGCGTGELAYRLAALSGARVTGVDLSAKFIHHATVAHSHPGLRFIVADLSKESPTTEYDRYHFIVGNGILHHLFHRLDSFLPALARWLLPGGRLIFWEPNLYNPYIFLIFTFSFFRRLARLEPDEMAFTRTLISRKLTAAGFHDIQVDTRDFLLPNTPTFLIKPIVALGHKMERIPLIRHWAQSIFLRASHK